MIWWLAEPERLSEQVAHALRNLEHALWFSAAAVWEMAVKASLGRLEMPGDFLDALTEQGTSLLPIQAEHALSVRNLPFHHKDLFDRIQIAQARMEGLTIITADPAFQRYDVSLRSTN